MSFCIYRSINEPLRENLSFAERWRNLDKGLIICWEVGRKLSVSEPSLAERALNGELPLLAFKGGIEKETKNKEKFGTLYYLAQWQGLRSEDLNIDLDKEYEITCSKTGIKVTYTNDINKYLKSL